MVAACSPARDGVTGLAAGSRAGDVHHAVLPLTAAAAVAAVVGALVRLSTPRRGDED
ncbi:hypothetical protein ACFU5O_25575 [Streptomyces sp. NPDC057445]|uniref:hypothetical protein n=1 Tax=Streptomyces sp. NPDC057445 TaxID=3346136 RepID=UPI0036B83060